MEVIIAVLICHTTTATAIIGRVIHAFGADDVEGLPYRRVIKKLRFQMIGNIDFDETIKLQLTMDVNTRVGQGCNRKCESLQATFYQYFINKLAKLPESHICSGVTLGQQAARF